MKAASDSMQNVKISRRMIVIINVNINIIFNSDNKLKSSQQLQTQ